MGWATTPRTSDGPPVPPRPPSHVLPSPSCCLVFLLLPRASAGLVLRVAPGLARRTGGKVLQRRLGIGEGGEDCWERGIGRGGGGNPSAGASAFSCGRERCEVGGSGGGRRAVRGGAGLEVEMGSGGRVVRVAALFCFFSLSRTGSDLPEDCG